MEKNIYVFYSETFSSRVEEERFKFNLKDEVYSTQKMNTVFVKTFSILEKNKIIIKSFNNNKPNIILFLGCNHAALKKRIDDIMDMTSEDVDFFYTKRDGISNAILGALKIFFVHDLKYHTANN